VLPAWLELLLLPFAPALCRACGAQLAPGEGLCGACRAELTRLAPGQPPAAGIPVWAPVAYAGPARDLVAGLKFRGGRAVAAEMAAQIAAASPQGLLAGSALVPVPLHPARARVRGFNQACEIAARLSSLTGLAVSDCLVREGPPTRQVGRDRAGRARSIAGRIVAAPRQVPPRSALLVDDVITTGSTVAACAAALRDAGARHVAAVSYARTIGR
jgi:ComF family protein